MYFLPSYFTFIRYRYILILSSLYFWVFQVAAFKDVSPTNFCDHFFFSQSYKPYTLQLNVYISEFGTDKYQFKKLAKLSQYND
jgi:hypothetical protein